MRTGRLTGVAWLLLAATVFDRSALAEDDVVYRRNGIIDRGRITAYDAVGVRLVRSDTRREIAVPSDQIERVEVKLTPQHQEADALLERKQYGAAAEKFERAFEVETRAWLRGRIASNLVACHVAAGDPVAAAEAFLQASRSPDVQISLASAPIWWLPAPTPPRVAQYATTLLRSSNPLQQVLGASFLLGTDQSASARSVLVKLTTYHDERIGQLARAQLWRWETQTATLDEVTAWQRQVTRMPAESRGGPYFAIGLAFRRLGAHEEAALAFLWPALVYRHDPKLSSQAALLAAESLEAAGQSAEARQLYEEVALQYSPSGDASAAQRRLDAMKE